VITITITDPERNQANVRVDDPGNILRDLGPARQLMVRALMAIEGQIGDIDQVDMPMDSLARLRNLLVLEGANTKGKARRLLLMALMQLDDEDSSMRLLVPVAGLPIIAR
jgi:hypothetical protein